MNKMSKIAELLGVELGEKFKIKGELNGEGFHEFVLTEKGLRDEEGALWFGALERLFTGKYEIIKIPFEPTFGEPFYYVDIDGKVVKTMNRDITFDYLLKMMGNRFRTEEEALKYREEMMAKYEKGNV